MGMFNTIFADLMCPTKHEMARNSEIQIKWQVPEQRQLVAYREGDVLEGIEDEYDNTWIKTDYICNVCSKKTKGWRGVAFVKTMDQSRHPVFVRIEHGQVVAVLGESEFSEKGVKGFVEYL